MLIVMMCVIAHILQVVCNNWAKDKQAKNNTPSRMVQRMCDVSSEYMPTCAFCLLSNFCQN